jgi:hypothetical protein
MRLRLKIWPRSASLVKLNADDMFRRLVRRLSLPSYLPLV